jgi:hypothetical protein
MKKLVWFVMAAVVLSIFNACQKSDELIDQSIDAQSQEAIKPDVYSENGYLVFKSMDILDSVASAMNLTSDEEQLIWEQSLQFESARTYRSKLNEEIFGTDDYSQFLSRANKAATEGYYNKNDSCMNYPFSIFSWASVLNKDGIVGIKDYLYLFTPKGQIMIYKGTPELLKMAKAGNSLPGDIKIMRYENTLKSTIYTSYGEYQKESKYNGSKRRFTVCIKYNEIKEARDVIGPGGIISVNLPVAVKHDLYIHQEYKGTFGWRDSKTHLYHRPHAIDIGGNTVSQNNFHYGRINNTYSNPSTITSSNDLSNHYINLYWSSYPFDLIEFQSAPPVSPQITLVKFDVWTGQVGSSTDFLAYTVN